MQTHQQSSIVVNVPGDIRRRHPRVLYSAPIDLHSLAAGITDSFHGISLDISQGGVGALINGGPLVGETVRVELSLGGRVLRASAVVRHRSGSHSGFEFLTLSAEDQKQIATLTGNA